MTRSPPAATGPSTPTVDTDCGDYFHTVAGERLRREDRISALLSSAPDELPGALFIPGTTGNQGLLYPRFHHIALLTRPRAAGDT